MRWVVLSEALEKSVKTVPNFHPSPPNSIWLGWDHCEITSKTRIDTLLIWNQRSSLNIRRYTTARIHIASLRQSCKCKKLPWNNLSEISRSFLSLSDTTMVKIVSDYEETSNSLNIIFDFILSSKRSDGPKL